MQLDFRYDLLRHRYLHYGVRTVAASTTAGAAGESVILVTAAATITLPQAESNRGRSFYIKRTGAGAVSVAVLAGDTIDGAAGPVVLAVLPVVPGTNAATANAILVVSDGSNWFIIASY